MGVIVYVACLVMGLPDAALIAVVNGITNIIPYFGPYIGAIPSALLIFVDDPVKCIWFIIFIFDSAAGGWQYYRPKILSGKVGLSSFSGAVLHASVRPVWLCGLLIGAGVCGVFIDQKSDLLGAG